MFFLFLFSFAALLLGCGSGEPTLIPLPPLPPGMAGGGVERNTELEAAELAADLAELAAWRAGARSLLVTPVAPPPAVIAAPPAVIAAPGGGLDSPDPPVVTSLIPYDGWPAVLVTPDPALDGVPGVSVPTSVPAVSPVVPAFPGVSVSPAFSGIGGATPAARPIVVVGADADGAAGIDRWFGRFLSQVGDSRHDALDPPAALAGFRPPPGWRFDLGGSGKMASLDNPNLRFSFRYLLLPDTGRAGFEFLAEVPSPQDMDPSLYPGDTGPGDAGLSFSNMGISVEERGGIDVASRVTGVLGYSVGCVPFMERRAWVDGEGVHLWHFYYCLEPDRSDVTELDSFFVLVEALMPGV